MQNTWSASCVQQDRRAKYGTNCTESDRKLVGPGNETTQTPLVASALHAVSHGFQKHSVPMLCSGIVPDLATPLPGHLDKLFLVAIY